MSRRRADLALVGNTVIWGATFTLVKTAIGSVSPILFLALRFSLATAALAVFFRFRGGCALWPLTASFGTAGKPLADGASSGPGSVPSHGPVPNHGPAPSHGPVPSRDQRAPREGVGATPKPLPDARDPVPSRDQRAPLEGVGATPKPLPDARGPAPSRDQRAHREGVVPGPGTISHGRRPGPLAGPSSEPRGAAGRERRTRWWPDWWPGALTGAFLFCGYLLQTQGLRFTTAPKSAFLTGLASVMVPLLGALVYKSRPQVSEVVGVVVATAGLGLMTLQGAIGSIGRGDLLTLLGALGFAAHVVALGHFSEHMSFESLSVMQVGSAAVLSLALCWWVERPHAEWRPVVVCAILITGFLATALAFTVQAWAQQFTTSTRTALIYMLEPVFAWMTSYVWAGENLTGRAAVGAVFILGGVMLVEMKPLYPRLHPSQ